MYQGTFGLPLPAPEPDPKMYLRTYYFELVEVLLSCHAYPIFQSEQMRVMFSRKVKPHEFS